MMKHTISRRSFLRAGSAAAAGLALSGPFSAAYGAHHAKKQAIGVQLYTLRTLMEQDVQATLAKVGEAGYKEVEFAGYFDKPLSDIAMWLKDSGLTAPSTHINTYNLENNFDAALEAANRLGHKHMFLNWLAPEDRTVDRYKEIASLLNKNGEKARAAGVRLGHHNHEFEFDDLGGTTGFGILATETDPNLVEFELDIYWTRVAKVDPITIFKAHPGRFPCVHVKDYADGGNMADVGDGEIDYKAIYEARNLGGIKHFFVERDDATDPVRTINRSFNAFNKMVNG